jgi:hypothetical protein
VPLHQDLDDGRADDGDELGNDGLVCVTHPDDPLKPQVVALQRLLALKLAHELVDLNQKATGSGLRETNQSKAWSKREGYMPHLLQAAALASSMEAATTANMVACALPMLSSMKRR